MINLNSKAQNIPDFKSFVITHGLFGILEYTLILISIFIYISNLVLLMLCIVIVSLLIMVLAYTIITKNPYYYITYIGLICLTITPTTIFMFHYLGFTDWSFEPIKILVIITLISEAFYIYFLIKEFGSNKHLNYLHRKYGYPVSAAASGMRGLFFSVREFDHLNKGRQNWQDRDPEEIKKMTKELDNFEKKFKKRFLLFFQIISVLGINFIFYISHAIP
jgi:hypothetical protein